MNESLVFSSFQLQLSTLELLDYRIFFIHDIIRVLVSSSYVIFRMDCTLRSCPIVSFGVQAQLLVQGW